MQLVTRGCQFQKGNKDQVEREIKPFSPICASFALKTFKKSDITPRFTGPRFFTNASFFIANLKFPFCSYFLETSPLYVSVCVCDDDDDELTINCFCGMVDQRKAFSLLSSWDHGQRSSPSWISDMLRAGFEPVQNLS